MKSYTELLSKNNVDENQLSPALKKMVKGYKDIQEFITQCETKLQSGKLSDRKKQSLEDELAEARETLTEMEGELLKKVQYWLDNREAFKAKGERLKQGREAKKNGTGAASTEGAGSTAPAVPASSPQPQHITPASTTPASGTTTDNNGNGSTGQNQVPVKKKDNSGWIIGTIFITLICAVAGVSYYNSKQQTI